MMKLRITTCAALAALLTSAPATAQTPGHVKSWSRINSVEGGFTGALQFNDQFGLDVANAGDVNGDGVTDLMVGNAGDDDGGNGQLTDDHGAVWLIFLNPDGTSNGHQKISDTEGNFSYDLKGSDWFGYGVEGIGDLDGDGSFDLMAGAGGDDTAGGPGDLGFGALYTLFLNPDGTVRQHVKMTSDEMGVSDLMDNNDRMGFSIAGMSDIDGNGVRDIVTGAVFDDDGGFEAGAVYTIFMTASGNPLGAVKISALTGGVTPPLGALDEFGRAVGNAGDIDGDGIDDLLVGAFGDGDSGPLSGAAYLIFMASDGTSREVVKYTTGSGGFGGTINPGDRFGASVAGIGDLDADGTPDIAVGSSRGPLFALGEQSLHILFLNPDGSVREHTKITTGQSGFDGVLTDGDRFGSSIHALGDLDGDGIMDLAVGANGDDAGGLDRGTIWILNLDGEPTANWRNLLSGLAGISGTPKLIGVGSLAAMSSGELRLRNARPASSAFFIAGFGQLGAPFKAGVLVPTPDLVLPPLTIDSEGAFTLPFIWPPNVPAGTKIYLQAWLRDDAGFVGWAASNALEATQP